MWASGLTQSTDNGSVPGRRSYVLELCAFVGVLLHRRSVKGLSFCDRSTQDSCERSAVLLAVRLQKNSVDWLIFFPKIIYTGYYIVVKTLFSNATRLKNNYLKMCCIMV